MRFFSGMLLSARRSESETSTHRSHVVLFSTSRCIVRGGDEKMLEELSILRKYHTHKRTHLAGWT